MESQDMRIKAWMIAVCLLALLIPGCSSTSTQNPADNPVSTVPGVVKVIGQEGAAAGQFTLPESIVQDSAGNFYIADTFNDRIEKFDRYGNYILSWGSSGTEDGQFSGSRGLAIDSGNNVYVTDVILHRVQKFDSSGNFITKWGSEGTRAGEFSAPFDISTDSLNNVYVVDANNNRVQKFDSTGRYLGQFGMQGTEDGQFDEPIGITIDRNDNIYVADGQNDRIQKFDRNMRFVGKWGETGTGDGQFITPYGLTAGYDGNIYVTDLENNRIQKFDASGNFLGKAARAGYREGELFDPSDVIVDQFGNLYVVDGNNHRVQIFTQAIFTVSAATTPKAPKLAYGPTTATPTASWMKDIAASGGVGSRQLSKLVIPGTHDTGTYGITANSPMADDGNFNGEEIVTDITDAIPKLCDKEYWCKPVLGKLLHSWVTPINNAGVTIIKNVQAPWSKSQDETILQQLNGGIRFLDLRVQALDGNFVIVHSMVSVPMSEVLKDIATFCNNPDSSNEIILVAINKVYKMDGHHDELVNLIKEKLVNSNNDSLLIDRSDPSMVSLNSLGTMPGRVILFYPDAETVGKHTELWLKNSGDKNKVEANDKNAIVRTLVNMWPDTTNSDTLLKMTMSNRIDFLTSYPDSYSKYFYVSQLIRTQDELTIAVGVKCQVYTYFIKDLNNAERYVFKKLWKRLKLPIPPLVGPTNLLDWGSDTNDDVMGTFFQNAVPDRWNILMADNYKKGPVDFVQQIILLNKKM